MLSLERDGTFTEAYNGPGSMVWSLVKDKPRPKNGQYQVALSTLRRLMVGMPVSLRLERVAVAPNR